MSADKSFYSIALSVIPGIGSITARKLISDFGCPEEVFRQRKEVLQNLPFISDKVANSIIKPDHLIMAEKEMDLAIRHNIRVLKYDDKDFPYRLNECPDGPIVLFVKGEADLNKKRILSIVGTRSPTSYGIEICRRLIEEISAEKLKVVIVSGLAYGIDVCAHKAALKNGQSTWAVLGHGLGFLYPGLHKNVARRMLESGVLITDFTYREKPERKNFIKRNRIIAGISDATIVIESGTRGGALLTAQMADSYHKDVMTFPGRTIDPMSSGCNHLIKEHKAHIIESWQDAKYVMGWDEMSDISLQRTLFRDRTDDENLILQCLEQHGESLIDLICLQTGMPVSKISTLLLDLEFAGEIISLPGDRYRLAF